MWQGKGEKLTTNFLPQISSKKAHLFFSVYASLPPEASGKKVRRHNKNQVDKFFIFSRTKKINSHRELPRRLLVGGRGLVPHLGVYFFYFPRLSLKHKKCTVFFFVFIIHLSTTHRIHDTIPPLFLLLLSHRPLFTHCSVPPPPNEAPPS